MIDDDPEWMKTLARILTEKDKKDKSDIKQPTNEELEKMTMSEIVKLAKQTAIQELKEEGIKIKDDGPNECCKKYYKERMDLIIDIISDSRFWELVDKIKRK